MGGGGGGGAQNCALPMSCNDIHEGFDSIHVVAKQQCSQ